MTDTFIDAPADPTSDRNQLFAAILLGIAATLTAFSAYSAALKDGEALQGYTKSTRTLNDANSFYAQGNQTFALDQQLFVAYATAAQEGNAELATYLTTLMRDELKQAVEWWGKDGNEADTPFDEAEDNPYTLEDAEEAERLETQAEEEFVDGSEADDVGDKFELATVFYALTLFFGGIATLFAKNALTRVLLVAGLGSLVIGAVSMASALGG